MKTIILEHNYKDEKIIIVDTDEKIDSFIDEFAKRSEDILKSAMNVDVQFPLPTAIYGDKTNDFGVRMTQTLQARYNAKKQIRLENAFYCDYSISEDKIQNLNVEQIKELYG